ncbi:hypothetical protein JCM10212_005171 [Sporobolomyces blumeae]
MFFARFALPLLGLAASVLATSSPSDGAHDRFALEKRHNKCGCEVSVETSLKTAIKQIQHAGVSIKTACKVNKHKGNHAIVAAVKPHLVEIHTSLKAVSGAVHLHKADLLRATVDVHGLGKLVASLLNCVVAALLPLQLLVKANLGLRLLLGPLLKLLSIELVSICKGLFGAVGGLLDVVLGLVNGSLFVVLHSLGNIFAGLFGVLGLGLSLGCF